MFPPHPSSSCSPSRSPCYEGGLSCWPGPPCPPCPACPLRRGSRRSRGGGPPSWPGPGSSPCPTWFRLSAAWTCQSRSGAAGACAPRLWPGAPCRAACGRAVAAASLSALCRSPAEPWCPRRSRETQMKNREKTNGDICMIDLTNGTKLTNQ